MSENHQSDTLSPEIKSAQDNLTKIQYFDLLLEDSIVSKSDLDGNITFINKKFTQITGFTPQDAIGKNHNILRHPDTKLAVYEDLWNTIQSGKIWRERVLNKNKDGSDFWADSIIIPLKDADGKIIEYMAIRRDITDFLLAQRQLQKQRFEQVQQKKIAEAKDSFLILFTHELKTPLNAIINFTKYLLKHVNNDTIEKIPLEKRKRLLEQIESSATKMLADVTQLLELSRLKANKLYYNYSVVELKTVVESVISDHKSMAKEQRTTVKFTDSDDQVFIKTDPYRLKQIFANILSNAIKYGQGEVHVSIKTDEKLTICFEDNGKGIKDKQKAMELFEQTEGDIKTRNDKGTGIGLYFLKLLCKDLKIEYNMSDSTSLGGLQFCLTLPWDKGLK